MEIDLESLHPQEKERSGDRRRLAPAFAGGISFAGEERRFILVGFLEEPYTVLICGYGFFIFYTLEILKISF